MKSKKNKKTITFVLLVIVVIALVLFGAYYFIESQAKDKYPQDPALIHISPSSNE